MCPTALRTRRRAGTLRMSMSPPLPSLVVDQVYGIFLYTKCTCTYGKLNISFLQVNITVYYETLCPDSKAFILSMLYPNFPKLKDYISLRLVPFGKANVSIYE